jgi:hypothetical protein
VLFVVAVVAVVAVEVNFHVVIAILLLVVV